MAHVKTNKELEQLFKAVANRRRVAILRFLQKRGEVSVSDIAGHLKLSVSTASRHLDILERAGFLAERQKSLIVFYRINPTCRGALRSLLRIIL